MMETATRQIEERKKQLSFVAPVPIVQVKKKQYQELVLWLAYRICVFRKAQGNKKKWSAIRAGR